MRSSVIRPASLVAESTEIKYEGELGEAALLGDDQQPLLPPPLQKIVLDYLASDVGADQNRYSEKHLAEFKLFRMPIAGAGQIAEHIGSGARTKALELIRKDPSKLHCVAEARDGLGRKALGSLLYLAAAMGDFILVAEMKKLLPEQEARALLQTGFSPGWEDEQNVRDSRYISAAKQFLDRLKARKLPENMAYAQALEEVKDCILELRVSLQPKPHDPVITRGFIVNPQVYQTIRELFLKSEDDLGSLNIEILWGMGFQSLLAVGPTLMGQFLITGAKKFGISSYKSPEVLIFDDGTPFYDPSPLSGLGATFIVALWGDKYLIQESGWHLLRIGSWLRLEDYFMKPYIEQHQQLLPNPCNFRLEKR